MYDISVRATSLAKIILGRPILCLTIIIISQLCYKQKCFNGDQHQKKKNEKRKKYITHITLTYYGAFLFARPRRVRVTLKG
jgi:hypothetical protein